MQLRHRPRHATPTSRPTSRPSSVPVLTWDAAIGPSVLLVAALVALSVPSVDLTLKTVHPAPSRFPATSQQDGRHWSGGRQDP